MKKANIRFFWHSECYLDFSGFHAWEIEGLDRNFKRLAKSHKPTHTNNSNEVITCNDAEYCKIFQSTAKRAHWKEEMVQESILRWNTNKSRISRSIIMLACWGLSPDWPFLFVFSWLNCFYRRDFREVWHCFLGKAGRFMLRLLQAAVMISLYNTKIVILCAYTECLMNALSYMHFISVCIAA